MKMKNDSLNIFRNNKEDFNEYFNGRDNAFAYKLGSVIEYKKPLELKKFGVKTAPQSFVYL